LRTQWLRHYYDEKRGIGRRFVRRVRALLAMEIDRRIARIVRRWPVSRFFAFLTEALERCPRCLLGAAA
jgi:hypothetical protein